MIYQWITIMIFQKLPVLQKNDYLISICSSKNSPAKFWVIFLYKNKKPLPLIVIEYEKHNN